MKIALLANILINETGGRALLESCGRILLQKCSSMPMELYLVASREYEVYKEWFTGFPSDIRIVFYPGDRWKLIEYLMELQIDVVLPSFISLGETFPIPWVGYIFDCQHKYYPEFFTAAEIQNRDLLFSRMLGEATTVMVFAQRVKEDLEKYYPNISSEVIVMPFAAIPDPIWFVDEEEVATKYHLPDQYFIISNQFWIHKGYDTAVLALDLLRRQLKKDVSILCTGNTHDPRFPNYFPQLLDKIRNLGLQQHIRILGYIPKQHQMQIMRRAIGLLQPTLFEGGAGGGAKHFD